MKTMWNHFIMVATITSISIVVFAMLAPAIDQGTQEARATMAYSAVRTLPGTFVGEATRDPTALQELDPWGNAYVVETLEDGQLRVTSAGPNGVFDSTSAGSDDIWTDMPTSPMQPFQTQRNRELVRAIAVGFLTWIAFMAAYWWSERSVARRRASTTNASSKM